MTHSQHIKDKVSEFKNHPCFKYANEAVTLQQLRASTDGTNSPCAKENLVDWLTTALTESYERGRKEVLEEAEKAVRDVYEDDSISNQMVGGSMLKALTNLQEEV